MLGNSRRQPLISLLTRQYDASYSSKVLASAEILYSSTHLGLKSGIADVPGANPEKMVNGDWTFIAPDPGQRGVSTTLSPSGPTRRTIIQYDNDCYTQNH